MGFGRYLIIIITSVYCVAQTTNEIFQVFKNTYGRVYRTEFEELTAFRNFEANLKLINAQNERFKRGLSKFGMGIWNFSDFTPQDFATKGLNGFKGRPRKRSLAPNFSNGNIPENLNYVTSGLVTRVMFQGFCGSCWSFAAIGAVEGQLKKATGTLTKLSEQNLIDCNRHDIYGNWGCEGGNYVTAFEFLIWSQGGVVPLSSYAYKATDNNPCNYNYLNAVGFITDWVELTLNSEEELKLALANVGPIAVAIDASLVSFQQYKSGIYDDPFCTNEPNHAVLLTGYGIDEYDKKYWTIKNSWGVNWGENGYMRLARNANNLCKIAMFPSYPLV